MDGTIVSEEAVKRQELTNLYKYRDLARELEKEYDGGNWRSPLKTLQEGLEMLNTWESWNHSNKIINEIICVFNDYCHLIPSKTNLIKKYLIADLAKEHLKNKWLSQAALYLEKCVLNRKKH